MFRSPCAGLAAHTPGRVWSVEGAWRQAMRTRSSCCWGRAARPGARRPGCWPTGTSSMAERLRGPGSCGCTGACPRAHQQSAATAELGAAFGCCRLQSQGACWPWPLRQGAFSLQTVGWWQGLVSASLGLQRAVPWQRCKWGVLGTDPSFLARPARVAPKDASALAAGKRGRAWRTQTCLSLIHI